MGNGIPAKLKRMKLEHTSLGLLMSWIYCSWFGPSLFNNAGLTTQNDVSWLVSTLCCVTAIFGSSAILKTRQISQIPHIPEALVFGIFLGTLLEGMPQGISAPYAILVAGSILTGLASGAFFVVISEQVAAYSGEDIRTVAFLAAIVILVCFTCSIILPAPFSMFFVSLLPFCSCFAFKSASQQALEVENSAETDSCPLQKETAAQTAFRSHHQSQDEFGKCQTVIRHVFTASVAAVAIAAFCWATAPDAAAMEISSPIVGAFFGVFLLFCVTGYSLFFEADINIAHLYRYLVPTLIAAIGLLVVGGSLFCFTGEVLLIALSMAFDAFLMLYFGSFLKERFANPLRALCYCEGFTNLGIFLGNAGGIAALRLFDLSSAELHVIYLVLIVFASVVLAFVAEQQMSIAKMRKVVEPNAAFEQLAVERGLTTREKEVLELLGQGRSVPFMYNVDIAHAR